MDNKSLQESHNSRIYSNFLVHWKYVKREKIQGAKKGENQWKYFYTEVSKSDSSKTSLASDDKKRRKIAERVEKAAEESVNRKASYEKEIEQLQKDGYSEAQARNRVSEDTWQKVKNDRYWNEKRANELKEEQTKVNAVRVENLKLRSGTLTKDELSEHDTKIDESWQDKKMTLSDLPTMSMAENPSETVKIVNPNYNLDSLDLSYATNCAICSLTYDMRQRGYDVEAGPMPYVNAETGEVFFDDFDILDMWGMEGDSLKLGVNVSTYVDSGIPSWYKDTTADDFVTFKEICDQYGFKDDGSQESVGKVIPYIKQEMLKCGDGAYGNLCVTWIDGGGHSVVWEVSNGELTIRDCQTNENYSIEDLADTVCSLSFLRTDNRELSDKAARIVKPRR